ncbi:hypothetical protein ANANG_G00098430, partial [Anguilla anguilla]
MLCTSSVAWCVLAPDRGACNCTARGFSTRTQRSVHRPVLAVARRRRASAPHRGNPERFSARSSARFSVSDFSNPPFKRAPVRCRQRRFVRSSLLEGRRRLKETMLAVPAEGRLVCSHIASVLLSCSAGFDLE